MAVWTYVVPIVLLILALLTWRHLLTILDAGASKFFSVLGFGGKVASVLGKGAISIIKEERRLQKRLELERQDRELEKSLAKAHKLLLEGELKSFAKAQQRIEQMLEKQSRPQDFQSLLVYLQKTSQNVQEEFSKVNESNRLLQQELSEIRSRLVQLDEVRKQEEKLASEAISREVQVAQALAVRQTQDAIHLEAQRMALIQQQVTIMGKIEICVNTEAQKYVQMIAAVKNQGMTRNTLMGVRDIHQSVGPVIAAEYKLLDAYNQGEDVIEGEIVEEQRLLSEVTQREMKLLGSGL